MKGVVPPQPFSSSRSSRFLSEGFLQLAAALNCLQRNQKGHHVERDSVHTAQGEASLLWMLRAHTGVGGYLRSCWDHGRVSSLLAWLLSRPDHSAYTAAEPAHPQEAGETQQTIFGFLFHPPPRAASECQYQHICIAALKVVNSEKLVSLPPRSSPP